MKISDRVTITEAEKDFQNQVDELVRSYQKVQEKMLNELFIKWKKKRLAELKEVKFPFYVSNECTGEFESSDTLLRELNRLPQEEQDKILLAMILKLESIRNEDYND